MNTLGSIQPQSEFTFPFKRIIKFIKTMQMCGALYINSCRKWRYVHRLFCTKFNVEQLLFEIFYDIIGTFGSIQP